MSEIPHSKFWRKVKSIKGIQDLLLKALVLYVLICDADLPKWVKATAIAALIYLIDPIDAVPDITPIIGYLDDLAILATAIATLSSHIQSHHNQQAEQILNDL